MLRFSLTRLATWLLLISVLLAVLGAFADTARFLLGHARWLGFEPLFDAGEEANLPTWWQSGLFALAAFASFALAIRTPPGGRPAAWRWRALGAWLLLLSLAEGAAFDQRFRPLLEGLRHGPAGGLFGTAGLLVAAASIAAACFVPLLRPLRGPRLLLAVAGVIWMMGAIGAQWAEGAWLASHPVASTGYVVLHACEEFGESLGAALALVALLAHLGRRGGVRLAFE